MTTTASQLINLPIPWYLPSMYGDIKLTAQGSQTEIEWVNLSPSEKLAMEVLCKKFDLVLSGDVGRLVVAKPIDKIESVLAKAMKRGRKLLSAVVFKNGKVEELHRMTDPEKTLTEKIKETSKEIVAGAKAATTVAQPTVGCPVPEFERAQVRATRVLKEFLTPQQLDDFERTQSFLVTGGDSGRQYLLTSRHASAAQLDKVGGRSVYDLTTKLPICVHDWTVPASEELLELALFLQLPNHETYATTLPPGHVHG